MSLPRPAVDSHKGSSNSRWLGLTWRKARSRPGPLLLMFAGCLIFYMFLFSGGRRRHTYYKDVSGELNARPAGSPSVSVSHQVLTNALYRQRLRRIWDPEQNIFKIDGNDARMRERHPDSSKAIEWSSGVVGTGTYLGPVDMRKDFVEGETGTDEPREVPSDDGQSWIDEFVRKNPLVVFSKSYCPYSRRAKELLSGMGLKPEVIEADLRDDTMELKAALGARTNHFTFPNIIIGGRSIGGSDDLQRLVSSGKFNEILAEVGVYPSNNP